MKTLHPYNMETLHPYAEALAAAARERRKRMFGEPASADVTPKQIASKIQAPTGEKYGTHKTKAAIEYQKGLGIKRDVPKPPKIKPPIWAENMREDANMATISLLVDKILDQKTEGHIFCQDIIKACCLYYKISKVQVTGQARFKDIVRCRQVAMFLSKVLTEQSFPAIGRMIGNRDHTTVLYAYRKISRQVLDDPKLRRDIHAIMRNL